MKAPLIVLSLTVLSACSDNALCKQACDKLYAEDQCHIQGLDGGDQYALTAHRRCMDECATALNKREGEVGAYNPFEQESSPRNVELENRIQAKIWIECIESKSCEDFDEGYCAPIW